MQRLWRSNHSDLLALSALVLLGFSISAIGGGVGTLKYQKYVSKVDVHQLFLLCLVPLLIALIYVLRAAIERSKTTQSSPFFINDQAIKSKDEDSLGVSEYATRFAERVLNDGSSDSLVFGIDAPWGIGKSSFINFCHEYWKNVALPQPIVHRFEPLRYADSVDLVDKFVNELINTIQEHAFVPSIRSLFSKYLRLVKRKSEVSFLGIKFEHEHGTGSVDEMLEALSTQLARLDRKSLLLWMILTA